MKKNFGEKIKALSATAKGRSKQATTPMRNINEELKQQRLDRVQFYGMAGFVLVMVAALYFSL